MRALIAVVAASLGVASASLVAGCGEKRETGTGTGHTTTPTSSTSPTTSTTP
jgi:hypothetical protein